MNTSYQKNACPPPLHHWKFWLLQTCRTWIFVHFLWGWNIFYFEVFTWHFGVGVWYLGIYIWKSGVSIWCLGQLVFKNTYLVFGSMYLGEISQGVQGLNLVSYFLYFWAPFLATYRLAMPKIAPFSENIWAPDGLHASVWTISTFHIALFSEKLCPVAFLTK